MKSKKLLKQALHERTKKLLAEIIRSFLCPIDYVRTMEIPAILEESGILKEKRNPLRILDISSPQMLSITLANFSSCWDIYYINPFQEETNEMIKLKSYMRLKNIKVLNRDITEA